MIANARPIVYPPRECSRVDGTPKVGYRTRREAQRVRRLFRKLEQRPYRCACGAFHLGHRSAS